MSIAATLALAVALGSDAFSMALGVGISGIRKKHILYISIIVLIFHIFMPLLGLFLGAVLGRTVGGLAGTIGASVLILIGLYNFVNALDIKKHLAKFFNLSGGTPGNMIMATDFWGMLLLATTVSLDALTVGFGLGAFDVNLTFTVLAFGTAAGLMTAAGCIFGRKIGTHLGDKAEMLGALILIIVGASMLFS
ncbi:MAG: manganese efflux pump [Clostridia bacterium]|nr:manganese efflux pump [Clostridia bacterium]